MAKPYSVAADVRKQSPFKDTVLIADAYITQKIAEADNLIDAMIGGPYHLPLASNPDIVVDLSKRIATLIIFREQASNIEVEAGMKIEDEWKIQMEALTGISKRTLKLFDSNSGELQLNSSALPNGYPNATSSNVNTANNTAPKLSMNQKF